MSELPKDLFSEQIGQETGQDLQKFRDGEMDRATIHARVHTRIETALNTIAAATGIEEKPENDEVYAPIPEQLERLKEAPSMAEPSITRGFRTLINEGIESGAFTRDEGAKLLEQLRFIEALHELQENGILEPTTQDLAEDTVARSLTIAILNGTTDQLPEQSILGGILSTEKGDTPLVRKMAAIREEDVKALFPEISDADAREKVTNAHTWAADVLLRE